MAKQIALFNHKGGVSKTTTTFNLGWMLAEKGKKVILADCDPQCNLTGMVLGFTEADEFESIYKSPGVMNIHEGLAPAFESRPVPIKAVECRPIKGRSNLHLLPGHIGLAEYEVTLGIAQELSGSLVTLQNLPGSLRHLFDLTAQKYEADYVLIDMSPSLGAINQNLFTTSDFFLVPMAPDYFSAMAVESLSSVLPKWAAWARQACTNPVLRDATYAFPAKNPRLLGTVIQKYRPRNSSPSAAFQRWIDQINERVRDKLIPALRSRDMLLSNSAYDAVGCSAGEPLLQMPDFNSLIALSQEHQSPVFDLSDSQLGQSGVVLENTRASMQSFRRSFSDAADKILRLIENA